MNCSHIGDLLTTYWDLPEHDLRRMLVDEHIKECPDCAEEFRLWEESKDLIRFTMEEEDLLQEPIAASTSSIVMKRIYEDESWRVPVSEKLYNFSFGMRKKLTGIIAFCLSLFICSMFYSILTEPKTNTKPAVVMDASVFGMQSPQMISTGGESLNVHNMSSAVASISEPFMYKMGPIQTYPDYLLALSIVGLVCTLLIMNWLSRTKA